MALTDFQRSVCRLIAQSRIESGESYVAGAAALNEILVAPRVSHDIDLFHDTEQALQASWEGDRKLLEAEGLAVEILRERQSFVEAVVSHAGERQVCTLERWNAFHRRRGSTESALSAGVVRFHPGSIRGALPSPVTPATGI
jgi:hypothetical protein